MNENDIKMLDDYEKWLYEEGRNEKTAIAYLQGIREFITWFENTIGEFNIEQVTALDLHDYRNYLNKIRKQAPYTINKKVAALKSLWTFALEKELVMVNPTLKLRQKRTSVQKLAPKWLNRREQEKLLHQIDQVKNPWKRARDRAIVVLLLGTGLRVEEAANLLISDLNVEKGLVTIRSGKGDKFNVLPINKDVKNSLKDWLDIRGESNVENVFLSERNHAYTVRGIQHLVKKLGEKANIEGLSAHKLRHTFCKNLVDAGMQLQVVAHLARHESLDTTRRYTQPSENELKQAVDSISRER